MPWEPLPDKTAEPRPVGESLDRLMDRLAGASVSTIEVIMDHWVDVVGDAAAASCAPVKVADGTLTIRADDPVWATELRWLEPTILGRVAALSGGTELTSIKVVSRPR